MFFKKIFYFESGKSCVNAFSDIWKVSSLDVKENKEAHYNIIFDPKTPIIESLPKIYEDIEKSSKRFESIVCVAGGFVGGSIKEKEIFEQMDKMYKMNLVSSILGIITYLLHNKLKLSKAGHLATKYLAPNGLIVFCGAAAVFKEPTPSMLAYHLAKTATHSLALNLAQRDDISGDATVTTILP